MLQFWRVLQQPPIKRQVIVMLEDMPLPRQFESDMLVLNVVESVLQISVSAVIHGSIKDRKDNSTTVHVIVDIDGLPQASKQQRTCGIIFTYAIVKMPLYAEKICNMQILAKYAINYVVVYLHSHIIGIPNGGIVHLLHCPDATSARLVHVVLLGLTSVHHQRKKCGRTLQLRTLDKWCLVNASDPPSTR